jgi:hypothetical protein
MGAFVLKGGKKKGKKQAVPVTHSITTEKARDIMATIRKRGKAYQIDYFDPAGKRIWKSFKKKNAEVELGTRVSLIRHMLQKAVEWDMMEQNPCGGVDLFKSGIAAGKDGNCHKTVTF